MASNLQNIAGDPRTQASLKHEAGSYNTRGDLFQALLREAKIATVAIEAFDVVTGQMNLAMAKPQRENGHY